MIKAIIFDLDNTILDTPSLGKDILDPVIAPLLASDLPEDIKRDAGKAFWHTAYEDVFMQFSIPESVAEEIRIEARRLEISKDRTIRTYGDEGVIRNLNVKKFLVTTGFTKFQLSKINALGIADLFDEIIIDQIDDLSSRKKKKKIFEEIMEINGWATDEVLVVGDNPRSELGAAKELGIKTVQTLRPGVTRWDDADYHIQNLQELEGIIST